MTTGWGTLQRDASLDGSTLSINGTTYAKGLGTHAESTILYNLSNNFTTFSSYIGVDDETQRGGSVQFQVFTDNTLFFESTIMRGNEAASRMQVNIRGKNTLKLVVNKGGDNIDNDHADWADALLSPVNPDYTIDNVTIACVGNSITQGDWLSDPSSQGYVALLQQMLGKNYRILNFGLSGRTMLTTPSGGYNKESKFRELFTTKPDIITIMLGTNKSRPSIWTTQTAFEADYIRFIDSLATITNTNPTHRLHPQILPVLCPPATDDNTYTISGSIIKNQILPSIRKVANAKKTSTIDAYTPFLPLMNLIWDGVHPDANGNTVLADLYCENLRNLALEQLPAIRLLWYGRPPAGAPAAKGNDTLDKPLLRIFPAPDSIRNGIAVIICPWGGYEGLAMGYEETDVAA